MTTQKHTEALTYADALRIARGCTDYGGGYRGDAALFEAYQHGIQTVITALTHADPKDSQTRALMAMGAQPQQPAGWRLVPVEPTQEWIDAAGEKGLRIGSIRSLISDVLACAPAHPSQQEDDVRDAARYRWLRKGNIDDIAVVRGLGAMDYGMSGVAYTYSEEIDGDDLDAAIDAELAKQGGKG